LLHRYRIGLMTEEPYHHQLLFGGKQEAAGQGDKGGIAEEVVSAAFRTWSASAMEDEISAIANIHGCWGEPTVVTHPDPSAKGVRAELGFWVESSRASSPVRPTGRKGVASRQETILLLLSLAALGLRGPT
jgi:hypothetical protein